MSENNFKVLNGKRFFIDPKIDKSTSVKVKNALLQLGGKVEEFLDRNVHFALSNDPALHTKRKEKDEAESPFSTSAASPATSVRATASGSRWRDVVRTVGRKPTNNLIDLAHSLGIRVRTIDEVWQWLSRKTKDLKTSDLPPRPKNIKLKKPCLKIEDHTTKPVYEEFQSFPKIDFGMQSNIPIVSNQSITKKINKVGKVDQKGFCECCQCAYLSESKHRKTLQHINYGEDKTNYKRLDSYLEKEHLDFKSFLSKHERSISAPSGKNVTHDHSAQITCKNLKESSAINTSCRNKYPEVSEHQVTTRCQQGKSTAATYTETATNSPMPLRRSPRKRKTSVLNFHTKQKCDSSLAPSSEDLLLLLKSSARDKIIPSDFLGF